MKKTKLFCIVILVAVVACAQLFIFNNLFIEMEKYSAMCYLYTDGTLVINSRDVDKSKKIYREYPNVNIYNNPSWYEERSKIKSVKFGSETYTRSLRNCFLQCSNLTKISFINFNFNEVLDMTRTFSGCSKLREIKFPNNTDTKKVVSFHGTFSGCSNLEAVDLSKLDVTKKCKDISSLFENCTNIKKVILPKKVKLSNVFTIKAIFANCINLKELHNFDYWRFENSLDYDCAFLNDQINPTININNQH